MWTWAQSTEGLVNWIIPTSEGNANPFKWLSLRISQLSGTPSNDLRIKIRNGITWSPEVHLSDYGPIQQPTEVCYGFPDSPCPDVVNLMTTIRIPLGAFGAHDNVEHVRLRFRGDSVINTFQVDNIQFSEYIFTP